MRYPNAKGSTPITSWQRKSGREEVAAKPPEAPRRRCPRREAGQARPLPAASPSNPSAAPPVVEAFLSPACARPRCTAFLQTGPAARGRCRFKRLSVGYPQAPQGHPLQQRLGTLQRRACPDPLRLAVKPSMGKDQKATKTSTTTKKLTSSNMNNKEASPPLLWQIAQT